jgi:hypothetical protein
LNSEGSRETFLRNDREGPTKAKMAGKKEAKQKAGPSGQIEKNREETECSAGVKNSSRRDKRRKAQRARQRPRQEQAMEAQDEKDIMCVRVRF